MSLARVWRAQQFEQLVGQELSVRILKNSIYRDTIAPVYLFAGTRGCGKTSAARIFAMALTCAVREQFVQKPKEITIPCGICRSCESARRGSHPDIIEMDAASHTGVDDVRQIIDATGFLPIMGSSKIYIIDEAHMLSKAACNALLKILEEPPVGVVFILATTELLKILETIRSRAITLLFEPLSREKLVSYLAHICTQESIVYDLDGLDAIARSTGGIVRDSLNALERVRMAGERVSGELVAQVLAPVVHDQAVRLCEAIFGEDQEGYTRYLDEILSVDSSSRAEKIYMALGDCARELLRESCGVVQKNISDTLKKYAREMGSERCAVLLELWVQYEPVIKKSAHARSILELLCFKWSSQKHSVQKESIKPVIEKTEKENNWQKFLHALTEKESMLGSLLAQARVLQESNVAVHIELPGELLFSSGIITERRAIWHPILTTLYGKSLDLIITESKIPIARPAARTASVRSTSTTAQKIIDQWGGTIISHE